MNNISNFLVKIDHFCDYFPFVSSITNVVNLFQKCVILPFIDEATILSNHYYKHIDEKSFVRCFLLIIPIVGNILVGIYDLSKKKDDDINKKPPISPSSPLKTPSTIEKENMRLLLEKDANTEIRVPIGKPFSIELWHSSSTGHSSWEVSQVPSFINQVDTYINYQDHSPGLCGGGDNYGFVFEPKAPGIGSIIMKLPCSFDKNREVEETFTIIAE